MYRILAVVGILLLPAASAFTVTLDGPDERLPPGLDGIPIALTAEATCDEVRERQILLSQSMLKQVLTVTVSPTTPDGVVASGPTTILIPTDACTDDPQGNASTGPIEYTLSAERDAPGLEELDFGFKAELEGGDLADPLPFSVSGVAIVGYYGAMSFEVPEPIFHVEIGTSHPVEMHMTNFGNAATVVRFSITEDPPEGVTITLPDDVVVGSVAKGQDNEAVAVATARFDTDDIGWVNQMRDFTIVAETWSLDDPSEEGNTGTMSVLFRAREIKGAPAPSPVLAVPLLAAAALFARRRP